MSLLGFKPGTPDCYVHTIPQKITVSGKFKEQILNELTWFDRDAEEKNEETEVQVDPELTEPHLVAGGGGGAADGDGDLDDSALAGSVVPGDSCLFCCLPRFFTL